MKRFIIGAALCLAVPTAVGAQSVVGSVHDLTGTFTETQVCVFCHTPHNALVAVPLWNHASATASSFTLYDSPTLDETANAEPQDISLMCLSCHDGVTNLDAYGGGAGTTAMGAVSANVGTDLSDDHPVSISYTNADGGFNTTISLPLYGTGGDQVECGSCHNPHDNTTYAMFLRMDNSSSGLCLECHIK